MNRWYAESPIAAVANGMRAAFLDLGAWFMSEVGYRTAEYLVVVLACVVLVAFICGVRP